MINSTLKLRGLLIVLFMAFALMNCGGGAGADKSWWTAGLIETDNTGAANNPKIAIDSGGNAMAIWSQSDGTTFNIWANHYVAGSGWSSAELIETDNTGDAYYPQIAIDSNGDAMAVWHQHDGTRNNIWANRYVAGAGWSTAELIETDNAGSANNPQIAIDSGGDAIAVWYQHDGTIYNIWANRYVVGSGWSTAELIETDNAGFALNPQIAIDSGGDAIAVWEQDDGTRFNIRANRYVVGTGWSTAELIETDNAGHAFNSQIAIDSGGNAIAVWDQSDGTRTNIRANRYVVGSGWSSAELIETDNTGSALNPQIAIDSGGDAIAVWRQYDGTTFNIWANRYVAGSGWSSAELIETDNTGDAYYPQIAIDSNGDAIAVWEQDDGTRTNIWANTWY